MFERRLKIFLVFLGAVTAVLIARAVEVQLMHHDYWVSQAAESMRHATYTETTRGSLLDCKGKILAVDEPSMDASVDYRAIPDEPDPVWVKNLAIARIKSSPGDDRKATKARIADETTNVLNDITLMWQLLAHQADMSDDEMLEKRHAIVRRVELHRRHSWYHKQQSQETLVPISISALGKATTEPSADAVRDWLDGDSDVVPFENFDIRVAEQEQAHVILRSIDQETYNRLGKMQERMPFLILAPRMERHYPFNETACHLIGNLQPVDASDLSDETGDDEPLRAYHNNDLIGRSGLEELCEPLLRGTRGRETREPDANGVIVEHQDESRPGKDVTTTIDIDLQSEIEKAFNHVNVKRHGADPDLFVDLHGAALIIDVPTGKVRAMASVPGYDLNNFDVRYPAMSQDDLDFPLRNRATQSMTETGSIIKPVVGIGAITAGVMGVNDTVPCDGYLYYNGKPQPHYRCWTMSEWEKPGHVIPAADPHPGPLTFSDALQRSCNVFFETMGDRLDVDGLAHWMRTFGLGRITGVGISEVRGRLPGFQSESLNGLDRKNYSWGDAIGQKEVAATPIQMANVAATIARGGLWKRPRLVDDDISHSLRESASTKPVDEKAGEFNWMTLPDQQDLNLNPAAVAAAQDGMFRVVNTIAGTGAVLFHENLQISGKTGTAQAAKFSVKARDDQGKVIYDGKEARKEDLVPSTPENLNAQAPWYLGFIEVDKLGRRTMELKHSWFIGFFPSQHPKIAFSVLVEYGGSGSGAAGTIANKIIDACIEHGYVSPDTQVHELVQ